jgi:hypothetical protein
MVGGGGGGWSLQEWLNVNWTRKAKELLAPNILALSCHFNVVRVRAHHDTTAHDHTHAHTRWQRNRALTESPRCRCASAQMSNWVTYEVLSEPRNDARAKLIQKFARIAVVRKTPRIRTHAHTQRHTQHHTTHTKWWLNATCQTEMPTAEQLQRIVGDLGWTRQCCGHAPHQDLEGRYAAGWPPLRPVLSPSR